MITLKNNLLLLKNQAIELKFSGIVKSFISDLILGRSLFQWIYLLVLTSIPIIIEISNNQKDPIGFIASISGILCVIYVAEGRITNYLWGIINCIAYLILSWNAVMYGELITTIYFLVMQPIGIYMWLVNKNKKSKKQKFVAKKLSVSGWVKAILGMIIIWLTLGYFYQSIGSQRSFRDSSTDGTQWIAQLLMNGNYSAQWVFWIMTNVLSIYLWWGANIQATGMYFVFLINSCVGLYRWRKEEKYEV